MLTTTLTTTNAPSTFDQIKAILQLPFMVLIVIPSIIYTLTQPITFQVNPLPLWFYQVMGSVFLVFGLIFFSLSLNLFIKIGKGTLAPWNPTRNMVTEGLYRHVRNPMIMGVIFILISEALLLQSISIFLMMLLFMTVKHIYFVKKEEPSLIRRFGEEYEEYSQNVPRWIPRITPWSPEY